MGITAGILIILISIAHNIYGEVKQLPELQKFTNDPIMIGSLRIMIYQGGLILMAVGVIQVLDSIEFIHLTGISAYFPLGIVFINLATSLLITILFHKEIFKVTILQFIVFIIIITLQFLSL